MDDPILKQIQGGWAAFGDGWAVHGETQQEAIQRFREASKRHLEIDAMPYVYEMQATPDIKPKERIAA